jgi:hypothetical protein
MATGHVIAILTHFEGFFEAQNRLIRKNDPAEPSGLLS